MLLPRDKANPFPTWGISPSALRTPLKFSISATIFTSVDKYKNTAQNSLSRELNSQIHDSCKPQHIGRTSKQLCCTKIIGAGWVRPPLHATSENFPITAKIFILARIYKGCDRKSLSCALNGQIRDSCAQHGVYTEVQSAILSLTMQNFLLSCLFPPLSLPVFTLFHSAQGKPIIWYLRKSISLSSYFIS